LSSHRLVVLPEAEDDVRNILNYSLQEWGFDEYTRLSNAILNAFETLARYPEIGSSRPDTPRHMRSFPIDPYVLFYFLDGEIIVIARVIHHRRDVKKVFRLPKRDPEGEI
jgi:toxin ParE1/3/4